MKKIILKTKILVILVLLSTIVTSCLDDEAIDFGKGPIVVQFNSSVATQNFLQDGSGAIYDFEVPVTYYGQDGTPIDESVTLTIAINTANTTATEGVEFSLPETQFTIPAGSNTANVILKVNSENLDAFDPKVVALEITDSSQKASSNKNVISLTLQAVCPSNLAGNYTYMNGNGRSASIEETGTGTYSVSSDNAFTGEYPIYISDVCGTITITGGFLPDNFGIPVSGTGSVSEDGNTITLIYTVDGYFSNRTMILQKNNN